MALELLIPLDDELTGAGPRAAPARARASAQRGEAGPHAPAGRGAHHVGPGLRRLRARRSTDGRARRSDGARRRATRDRPRRHRRRHRPHRAPALRARWWCASSRAWSASACTPAPSRRDGRRGALRPLLAASAALRGIAARRGDDLRRPAAARLRARTPGSPSCGCPRSSRARRSCRARSNPSVPEAVQMACFQVAGPRSRGGAGRRRRRARAERDDAARRPTTWPSAFDVLTRARRACCARAAVEGLRRRPAPRPRPRGRQPDRGHRALARTSATR